MRRLLTVLAIALATVMLSTQVVSAASDSRRRSERMSEAIKAYGLRFVDNFGSSPYLEPIEKSK